MTTETATAPKGPDLEAIAKLDPARGLVTKLAEVMGAIHRIPKTGYNSHFGYAFATEADVTEAVRAELAARHVILVPKITKRTVETRAGRNGDSYYTVLEIDLTFIDGDAEKPHTLSFPAIGESLDTQDKGTSKAYTAALKYALLKFFLIPTGDDPDAGPSRRQAEDAERTERSRALAAQQEAGRPGMPRPARVPPGRPVASAPGVPVPDPTTGMAVPSTRPGSKAPLPQEARDRIVAAGQQLGTAGGKQFVDQWIRSRGYHGWLDFIEYGAGDGARLLEELTAKVDLAVPTT